MSARPPDPARTSAALLSIGCILVAAAWAWGHWTTGPLSENDCVTQLTLVILGGSCFIGNLQAGSRGYRLAAVMALALAMALAWQTLRILREIAG